MPTITTDLPVVRPEGWDLPEVFVGVDTLSDMRDRIAANDAEVDKFRGLAMALERDNAYGVATLGLSIYDALSRGMTPADVAVALGYELTNADGKRLTAGPTFVGRYAVIGEAVSHGCDTDAVLALRTYVRDNGKGKGEAVLAAAKTDEGVDNDKLARAIVKAGQPVKAPTPDAEQVSKRLASAHNALAKVAKTVAEGTPLSDGDKETVTKIVTLINALTS